MNIAEKTNVRYRIIACLMLIIPLGIISYSVVHIFTTQDSDKVLTLITLFLTAAFCLFELILIAKGGKKELSLYKIAFNENQSINNIPLIAVIVGSVFGLGLTILGLVLFFTKNTEPTISSSLVIISVSVYLLINCIMFFTYVLMFKKRPVNLKDFI